MNFESVADDLSRYMQEHCKPPGMPTVEMLVDGVAVPSVFKNYCDKIMNMEVRPDDVWLVTFPKCGKII